jgi:hypothetical protein
LRRTKADLWHIAVHEAGHAVIGRVCGLLCGHVTINRNLLEGEEGYSQAGNIWDICAVWEQRGKLRSLKSIMIGRVLHDMAGAEAERVLIGCCKGGDNDDRYHAARILQFDLGRDDEKYERQLRRMCGMLAKRHRQTIEAVAKKLIEKRKLSGKAIDKLIKGKG